LEDVVFERVAYNYALYAFDFYDLQQTNKQKQTNNKTIKQPNKTKQNKNIKLSRHFHNLNTKSVDRAKLDTPNTHIHDRSLSWLGTCMPIK
jgi:hypothetical protein